MLCADSGASRVILSWRRGLQKGSLPLEPAFMRTSPTLTHMMLQFPGCYVIYYYPQLTCKNGSLLTKTNFFNF